MSNENKQVRQDGYKPEESIEVQKGYAPLGHQPVASSQKPDPGKANPPQSGSGVSGKKK